MYPNFVLLYVERPSVSAELYQRLLGLAPVESSPSFVMFALPSGTMLGLWARAGVEPPPTARSGAGELAFAIGSDAEVDACCVRWRSQGLPMAQDPVRLDFGYTFVALDPDGHRLRVFCPRG